MISRPLELVSRLRPPPRGFDTLFYVNAGLLVLFFSLFGSSAVRYPSVSLAELSNAAAMGQPADLSITVQSASLVFVGDTVLSSLDQLPAWLAGWRKKRAVGRTDQIRLLVLIDKSLPIEYLHRVNDIATLAGFSAHFAVEAPSK